MAIRPTKVAKSAALQVAHERIGAHHNKGLQVLPLKTTIDDLDALAAYLKTQVGWVAVAQVKKAIPSKHADNRKLEAMRYVGLIDRDGGNIKLTDSGREFGSAADESTSEQVLRGQLRSIPLYHQTAEWMHFSSKDAPTKTEVANYWHDSHQAELQGATGAALTDAVIFFLRFMDACGLGQFIGAGKGRPETYLRVDGEALSQYATGEAPEPATAAPVHRPSSLVDPTPPSGGLQPISVASSPAVHVNVEIHIAADAKAATVQEIFKNMRKYVLDLPPTDDE